MTTISSNFAAKCGEIDLEMRDRNQLAFIEARYRSHSRLGVAASGVNLKKPQKIIHCLRLFWQKSAKLANHPCRFNVITYDSGNGVGERVWIRTAF